MQQISKQSFGELLADALVHTSADMHVISRYLIINREQNRMSE